MHAHRVSSICLLFQQQKKEWKKIWIGCCIATQCRSVLFFYLLYNQLSSIIIMYYLLEMLCSGNKSNTTWSWLTKNVNFPISGICMSCLNTKWMCNIFLDKDHANANVSLLCVSFIYVGISMYKNCKWWKKLLNDVTVYDLKELVITRNFYWY